MNYVDMPHLSRTFSSRVKKLEKAEATTKEVLSLLSREVLAALHEHENIMFVNRLIKAKMTSTNKKVVLLFFKAFSGFHYDEDKGFTSKNKAKYEDVKKLALEKLSDAEWDIWQWADKSVDVEAKEWNPEKVTKYVESALKKVETGKASDKYGRGDIIAAIIRAGVTPEDIAKAMEGFIEPEAMAA